MSNGKTKLADIAERTGLSMATVSRVLNGRSVSQESRSLVLSALDELGYDKPIKLEDETTKLVGVITPALDNPIYPLFAQVLSTGLARHGLTPILCPVDVGGVTEDEYVQILLDHQVAGIVFISGRHADLTSDKMRYQRLTLAELPIVLVNGFSPDIKAPFVSDDDRIGIKLALDHLTSLGHTRIGLVTGPKSLVTTDRRIQAFREFMADQDVANPDHHIASSLLSIEGGEDAGRTLIDRGCTALICSSDYMALGAVRAAESRRLSVPGDISIVGYDDSTMVGFTNPSLTTIRQNVFAMGHAIVTLLSEEIGGEQASTSSELLFRPELVVRRSTGPAIIED